MSTNKTRISYPAISREIKRLTGEDVTAGYIGMLTRNATSSKRVKALIDQAVASLASQAKTVRKRSRKSVTA